VAKLLRLCQVTNLVALLQVWHNIASAPKKNDLTAMQQAFNDMAHRTLGMPGTDIPITPDIGTKSDTHDSIQNDQ